jgi:squalene synthase HpnC
MAVDHYENFPVASLLLPARLRPPVRAIYAFARSADDLADEGDAPPAARLAALAGYDEALRRMTQPGVPDMPLFADLQRAVRTWNLPLQPFHDLLSAFSQDVVTTRYTDFPALLDYCARSANPVGNLMLHLYAAANPENLRASDAICSALQIINFLQDVAIDWRKQRIYLPMEDLHRFGVTEAQIAAGVVDDAWCALMAFEVDRTRELMRSGASLAVRLPGRIGWELRLVVQGGLRILDRIEAAGYDVFRRRPVLGTRDWIAIGLAALRMRGAGPSQ